MRVVSRILLLVACLLLALGAGAALAGYVVGGPTATGLGFLALVTCAVPALTMLPVAAVLGILAARERDRPVPGT